MPRAIQLVAPLESDKLEELILFFWPLISPNLKPMECIKFRWKVTSKSNDQTIKHWKVENGQNPESFEDW